MEENQGHDTSGQRVLSNKIYLWMYRLLRVSVVSTKIYLRSYNVFHIKLVIYFSGNQAVQIIVEVVMFFQSII